jgi:cell wall-associated NlpC family hydrolase
MGSPGRLGAIALAVPFVVTLGVAVTAGASGATSPKTAPVTACGTSPVQADQPVDGITLGPGQLSNARIIYDVSVTMGLPQQAAVIAEATAMQESGLVNLPTGTSDSLGLFQQRPSQGWGTPAQIVQPVYASTRFYEALASVPGWQSLRLTVAAQAVQGSATPGAYAKWESLADSLVATFSGSADNCLTDNGTGVPQSGATRLPAGFALHPGTPQAVVTAIAYAAAQLGKPYIWGGVGPAGYDCSGLVMMAYEAAGISLPRTTFQQVYAGTPVYSDSQLGPGDLLFTPGSDGTSAEPGHVGMYIGSGLVIQAPQTGEDVEITPFSGYWQESTVAIRRIVQ